MILSRKWWNPRRTASRTEALQSTGKKVGQAIASTLGTAADLAHEVLFIGVDLLDLVPVPGLGPAARLLRSIWDASKLVDMNVLSCLRLTARCADTLIYVQRDIFPYAQELELLAPIRKLEESFEDIHRFLIKLTNRPFLKRYLRRDEILQDLSDCDSSLRDAVALFGISIQLRILKQVQVLEKHRQEETKALL